MGCDDSYDDSYRISQKYLCQSMIYLKMLNMMKRYVMFTYFIKIKEKWVSIIFKIYRTIIVKSTSNFISFINLCCMCTCIRVFVCVCVRALVVLVCHKA